MHIEGYPEWISMICGEKDRPITYGAYGEGEAPIFCGSIDLGYIDSWHQEKINIWYTEVIEEDEVGNFVFDKSESFGTLRWTKEELCEQGDFWDECFGYRETRKNIPKKHRVFMYSKENPAKVYKSIECVIYGPRTLANNGHDMILQDLKFLNSGVHGISGDGESRNLKVINCQFENIGGCVWNYDLKIRYGNAVETWNIAEDIEVRNCKFENIYDSAVTHQGSKKCQPANNVLFHSNKFMKCGMAAYEQRDKMPLHAEFVGNICLDAGMGFSMQGETMPRRSEIWPQPMGHHIFLWRIESPTDGGKLIIKDNFFGAAPYGSAIYSIISPEAEKQLQISDNKYLEGSNKNQRMGGTHE